MPTPKKMTKEQATDVRQLLALLASRCYSQQVPGEDAHVAVALDVEAAEVMGDDPVLPARWAKHADAWAAQVEAEEAEALALLEAEEAGDPVTPAPTPQEV